MVDRSLSGSEFVFGLEPPQYAFFSVPLHEFRLWTTPLSSIGTTNDARSLYDRLSNPLDLSSAERRCGDCHSQQVVEPHGKGLLARGPEGFLDAVG